MSKRLFIIYIAGLFSFTLLMSLYIVYIPAINKSIRPDPVKPNYELLGIRTQFADDVAHFDLYIVRLLIIQKNSVDVKEIFCYTEFEVQQVIGRLVL